MPHKRKSQLKMLSKEDGVTGLTSASAHQLAFRDQRVRTHTVTLNFYKKLPNNRRHE